MRYQAALRPDMSRCDGAGVYPERRSMQQESLPSRRGRVEPGAVMTSSLRFVSDRIFERALDGRWSSSVEDLIALRAGGGQQRR